MDGTKLEIYALTGYNHRLSPSHPLPPCPPHHHSQSTCAVLEPSVEMLAPLLALLAGSIYCFQQVIFHRAFDTNDHCRLRQKKKTLQIHKKQRSFSFY